MEKQLDQFKSGLKINVLLSVGRFVNNFQKDKIVRINYVNNKKCLYKTEPHYRALCHLAIEYDKNSWL